MNFVSLWSFLSTMQIIIYLRITNIPLPQKLNALLKAFQKTSSLPNPFVYAIDIQKSSKTSQVFYNFGYKTTNLLLNLGNLLTALSTICANMILFYILKRLTNFKPLSIGFVKNFIENTTKKFKYSAYLRFLIQFYLDFGICSIIGLSNKPIAYWTEILSLSLCVIIAILVILIPILIFWFIITHKNQILSHETETEEKFGSLFYEFSNDHGLFSSMFYVFYFLRRGIFIFIVFSLDNYPLVQVIMNYLLSISFMFYLIAHKPFSEVIINYVNIFTEFIIGVILITLPIQDTNVGDGIKNSLDDYYLYSIYMVLVAQVLAPIILTVRKIWTKIKMLRSRRKVGYVTTISGIDTAQNAKNEAWKT
ncbi:hypothetical protein SteCoe_23237 [Stentor coeruleus]|uniref:TRP C-terminal domain-containing protein n=1 Tax=Stentor coeruleus TaxID=5963 RepID=A0A1R2BKE8_9CILI|nr:hypothetical protein SteCoe_23237 [Stentor coeruleus]